jgi:PAS domain-containing protein
VKGTPIAAVLEQVMATGQTAEGKEMFIPLSPYDGAPLQDQYFNFIQQARYNDQGEVEGILTFAYEITELVLARKKLEQSEQALRILNAELEERVVRRTRELQLAQAEAENQRRLLHDFFMAAPAPIVILEGPELVYQLVNPDYQQPFPGHALLGNPLLKALPELAGTPIPAILDKVYHTGETFLASELPIMLARREGGPVEEIYWTFTYQARRDASGMADGVLVFANDVTDQVKARKSVERNRELLQLALEAGRMGTWHLDLRKDGSERSPLHDQIFGYPTLLPDWGYERFISHVLAEDKEGVRRQFRQSQQTGRLYFECRIRRADDQIRWIEVRGEVIYDEAHQPLRMAGVVTDVTERKSREEELYTVTDQLAAANQELSQANGHLLRVNEDLDNFVYTASHDLRSLINAMGGLVIALGRRMKGRLDPTDEVLLSHLSGSMQKLNRTINELSKIVKASKDTSQLFEPIDLPELLAEVKEGLSELLETAQAEL